MKVPLRDITGMFSLVEEFVECYVKGQRVEKENGWFLYHN